LKLTRSGLNKKMLHFLFTLPGVLLFAVFFLGPVSMGLFYSLTDYDGLSRQYEFIWFENYIQSFSDARFIGDIRFTLTYTVLLMVFVTGLSLLLALGLNYRKIRFRNVYRSAFFFPAVLGALVVGLIWNQIFYGVIPELGKQLGMESLSANLLSDPDLAIYGILFVNVWQGIAIPMVLFIAGLQSVPLHLYEAATMDGATPLQKFRNVTFPFLVPVLSIVLILNIRAGLTTFEYIMAMTGGGPGFSTESIGLLIYKQGFGNHRFGYGAAQSVLLLLAIAIFSVLQFAYLNRKGVDQQ
jgi:raffinose/stachyose/melibiose transport system permease protein